MKLSPESSAIIMRMVARRREKLKQSQQDSQQSDKPLPEIQAPTESNDQGDHSSSP